jgi:hypothetical protein
VVPRGVRCGAPLGNMPPNQKAPSITPEAFSLLHPFLPYCCIFCICPWFWGTGPVPAPAPADVSASHGALWHRRTGHNCHIYKPVGAPRMPSPRPRKIVQVQGAARSRWHMGASTAHLLRYEIISAKPTEVVFVQTPPRRVHEEGISQD